jgi:hypothetical protein
LDEWAVHGGFSRAPSKSDPFAPSAVQSVIVDDHNSIFCFCQYKLIDQEFHDLAECGEAVTRAKFPPLKASYRDVLRPSLDALYTPR